MLDQIDLLRVGLIALSFVPFIFILFAMCRRDKDYEALKGFLLEIEESARKMPDNMGK